jgi:hypothetical protein
VDHRVRDDLHPLTGQPNEKKFRLGNPLQSEQAAFRWVMAVIAAAAVVIAIAKLVSTAVGFVAALLLGVTVAVIAARGAWRMIRGEDELDGEGPEGAAAADSRRD